jgi:RNA polymerase sigma-70 factor (ECF subfamily)
MACSEALAASPLAVEAYVGGMTSQMPAAGQSGEVALMRRVAARDEAAFRLIAERHLGRILRLAQRMLGAADADEVAQEALLRVWLKADGWKPQRASLATWIYAITYNLCIDRLRRQRQQPSYRADAMDAALEIADPAPDAAAMLIEAHERANLAAALERLSPRQRAAISLFYEEGLDGAEAAAALGLSARAFWSLLQRARTSLAADLRSPRTPQEASISP